MMAIESAGLSDVGRKRKDNQDQLLLDDALSLFIVADGMGGHKGGETASRMVASLIRSFLAQRADGEGLDPEEPPDVALSPHANRLLAAIRFANAAVHRESQEHAHLSGMGSTLAAVWLTDNTFIAANVGDSPIYLIHRGEIEVLSVTHTVAAEAPLLLDGDAGQVEDSALGQMLTRGMGIGPTVQADVCEGPCFPGDRLVLCSDGLSSKLTPSEILGHVTAASSQEACRRLVDLANARGGDDNISVIVIRIASMGRRLQRLMAALGRVLPGAGLRRPI
jgi:protein phosphatase